MIAPFLAFLGALAASAAAVRLVLDWLSRRQILDHPNERSSHSQPTPRGGGLAVTPVILIGWLIADFAGAALSGQSIVMAGGLVLLLLSWQDDRVSLPARTRLAVHFLAVLGGLLALPADQLIFQGVLPFWADRAAAAFLWLWFLNLYNFMDGIDGITGVETLCLSAGLILLGFAPVPAAVTAGAAAGFLIWNWHPAKIFLGDSGSVPLGYLLGWLLLRLAGEGQWQAALILPAYYLADATIPLGKRGWRREKIWQAHRQHFYQQAVRGGASHRKVAMLILIGDVVLVAAATQEALAAALVVTAALLFALRRLGGRQTA